MSGLAPGILVSGVGGTPQTPELTCQHTASTLAGGIVSLGYTLLHNIADP